MALSIKVPSTIIEGEVATVTYTRKLDNPPSFEVLIQGLNIRIAVKSGGQTTWQEEYTVPAQLHTGCVVQSSSDSELDISQTLHCSRIVRHI